MGLVAQAGLGAGGSDVQSDGAIFRDASVAAEMLGQGLRWQPLSLPRGSEEETQEVETSDFPPGPGQRTKADCGS